MILTKEVVIKISSSNSEYWKNKGYNITNVGGRCGKNNGQQIKVKVSELLSGSNCVVLCKCNLCEKEYSQRYCRNTDICYPCRKIKLMQGNCHGTKNKGKKIISMTGNKHPRWNPNKKAFTEYAYKVRRITEETYKQNMNLINPDNLPRTLCGIEDGYQLDHKISIKWGFLHGVNPKVIGNISNLQMIPWNENRKKHINI